MSRNKTRVRRTLYIKIVPIMVRWFLVRGKMHFLICLFFTRNILQCSVSCGSGIKQRSVICRNTSGEPSSECFGAKPADTQPCHSKCDIDKYGELSPNMSWVKLDGAENLENNTNENLLDHYANETLEDEDYNDNITEEDIEPTRKTKVSANPK